MVTKTSKGWVRKQTTGDGRESNKRWAERETGMREQTKTTKKRQKKREENFEDMINRL